MAEAYRGWPKTPAQLYRYHLYIFCVRSVNEVQRYSLLIDERFISVGMEAKNTTVGLDGIWICQAGPSLCDTITLDCQQIYLSQNGSEAFE